MEMEPDEIIKRIMLTRQDLTRDEVLVMVEEKKKEAEGYFTTEGAARIVASELGVEILKEPFKPEIMIRDLVSGLNDVTIIGRIIIVYPTKTFTRPVKTGKVARLLIADKSGMLKAIFWNDKANLVEDGRVKQGEIVRILHGYAREGLDGKLEVHVGLRGSLQISPSGIINHEYPPVEHFFNKIGDITRKSVDTNVLGIVDYIHPVSVFVRKNGTQGKMRKLILRDETDQITIIFWNKKVDEIWEVKRGSYLRIMDARVKEGVNGRLEIHTKNITQIEMLNELKLPFKRFIKIKELKADLYNVKVLARVVQSGKVQEFRRRSGEMGRFCMLLLMDETGFVRFILWEEKTVLSQQIQIGDVVLIDGAYTRERFGEISLNLGNRGVLSLNPKIEEAEKLPYKEKTTAIAEVREEGGPITVQGILNTKPIIREVATARGERVTVSSFEFRDKTGEIRVSLWRGLADAVRDLTVGTWIKIRNAYVKKRLPDQLELTSRMLTSMEILQKQDSK